jgi:hypothetical protein
MFDSIKNYIIVACAAFFLGGWLIFGFTSHYYQGIISEANQKALEQKDAIQRNGDQLVANYIEQIDKLATHNATLQKQVTLAVGPSRCTISNGFVRLYNSSATGEASTPSSLDGTPSAIDAATLLSIAIENNEKYRRLADQLTQLQAFESQ